MIELLTNSDRLVELVPRAFHRYLYNEIDWNKRLTGIKGARGTGKTTLALQWLHRLGKPASEAAYFSLDDLYFLSHTLVETAQAFFQQGGKVLVLDEVHKYPRWAREVKILYDRFQDLQIVFTGSSIIDISRQEGDLSRRALMYELHGLSFREYLAMTGVHHLPPLTLNQLTKTPSGIRSLFPDQFRPLAHIKNYLKYGYYPFMLEDKPGYHQRLRQLVRLIVESDMAEIKGFDIRNARKLMQLLYIISQQVPFKPNLLKLSEKSGIHRNSISNYLHFLEEARLLRLLYPSGISIATLQKPEKIVMSNTNFMYAMSDREPSLGAVRETFVLSQLSVSHRVTQPKEGDFETEEQLVFEVGGPGKRIRQVSDKNMTYIIADDIEFSVSNIVPMWMIGFLY
ncbi:MAG: ATP-binding protein [Bacteroidales bacterium]|nr:ATP-binding protein [Bacteroidales bacterium]